MNRTWAPRTVASILNENFSSILYLCASRPSYAGRRRNTWSLHDIINPYSGPRSRPILRVALLTFFPLPIIMRTRATFAASFTREKVRGHLRGETAPVSGSADSDFECHAGAIMQPIAFRFCQLAEETLAKEFKLPRMRLFFFFFKF